MAVIGNKKKRKTPGVSTASLPDIIFTLLFFFMVSAKVKDTNIKLGYSAPAAVETKKLSSSDKPATIYIGKPLPAFRNVYGDKPVIQLDDQIKEAEDVRNWATVKMNEVDRNLRHKFIVNIKADGDVPTSLVSEVKIELRKAEALRINYDSKPLNY